MLQGGGGGSSQFWIHLQDQVEQFLQFRNSLQDLLKWTRREAMKVSGMEWELYGQVTVFCCLSGRGCLFASAARLVNQRNWRSLHCHPATIASVGHPKSWIIDRTNVRLLLMGKRRRRLAISSRMHPTAQTSETCTQ